MSIYHPNFDDIPFDEDDFDETRFAIVVSSWNGEITEALLQGALSTFQQHGIVRKNIDVYRVPGTIELTYGVAGVVSGKYSEGREYAAVIAIGCVIRGDTPHFDYVCQSVTQGITSINAKGECPVIFSVLTVNTLQQAKVRAGGKLGNKGSEGALTAMVMAEFHCESNST